jgi:hypothetical protein
MEMLFVGAGVAGFVAALIANNKGHSFIGYFFIGMFLGPIGILLAALTPGPGKLGQLTPASGEGWWPDPTGRFEYRYFNGRHWTLYVGRNGVRYEDPL